MPPEMPLPPHHQQLRQATHEAHVRLNRHPLLRQVTRPTLDIPTYTRILQTYWCFYRMAETLIAGCLARGLADFPYNDRYKTGWLEQDLTCFGILPDLSRCCRRRPALTAPRSPAELTGLMYPLEGSTLGGQVISRHLENSLGLTAGSGGRFFSGYGAETGSRWMQFMEFARRSMLTQEQQYQTCNYANRVFSALEALLDDPAF